MSYLEQSREPLRPVVATRGDLERCLAELSEADGPVAFDVERAHGYRYWPKAYLFQIRRSAAGTWLIDPTVFSAAELGRLVTQCGDVDWVIHAASQDLPSMFSAGVVPARVFDTELAGKLLGKVKVSLGALLESELGIKLRKAHSAVNWSRRPLKEDWLTYAALDVDYLLDLAEILQRQLKAVDRLAWARQEFAWELHHYAREPEERAEPWRRISKLPSIRSRAGLALARELWLERDAIAKRRDRPPTHILPDSAIVALASSISAAEDQVMLNDSIALSKAPGNRYANNWRQAYRRFRALSEVDYPTKRPEASNGPPHRRLWPAKKPAAAQRWQDFHKLLTALADRLGFQASLVISTSQLQRILWEDEPPGAQRLAELDVRPWQVDQLTELFARVYSE